jgi:nucleotide-binding universal stress UspA family protein
MTTVIVPLDGSAMAEQALPHARTLAGPEGLLLLLTCEYGGEPIAPRRYLDDRIGEIPGPTEARVTLDRDPAAAIVDTARAHPHALVCMTAHGRTAVGAAVLGSTAEAVARTIDGPLVLVGPQAVHDPARAAAANVVVGVDSVGTAEVVVPPAATFAARLHLHPWVFEAVHPAPYPFVADADVPSRAGAPRAAERASAMFAARELAAEQKVVAAADPADAIVRFARDLPASYVALATNARSGVARFAFGSVTMRVVHRSPAPVLVVRP